MNSMTGFGLARGRIGSSHFVFETRSVNHRFCEVNVRLPGEYVILEPEIVRRVRRRFSRGKIDLFLREERGVVEEEVGLARRAHRVLKRIQRELRLPGPLSLTDLLAFRDVLSRNRSGRVEKQRGKLLRLLEASLDHLGRARGEEGRGLQRWFEGRLKRLSRLLGAIEKGSGRHGEEKRRRLETRLRGLGSLNEERLTQEAALMAGRSDVTEEIVRLRSHLRELGRLVASKEPAGRKMDFLAQEMGREINTIGSKVQGIRLVREVIAFKSELEKVREQVQNVE